MGAPDIMAAVARKYDILQQTANSEAGLRQAQADVARGSLGSENALRASQALEASERARTLAPTAAAANAATYAGIPAQQAQAPYLRAQTRTLNDMLAPGGDTMGNWFADQHERQGGSFAPSLQVARPLADPTPSVTARGVAQYASGTPNVPGPGQTITGGSWEGPTAPSPPPAPIPPTPTTGGDLRRRLGLGIVRAYAEGTPNVQPSRGVPVSAPPVAYPIPAGAPASPSFGTRRPLTGYAEGTDNVPSAPTGPSSSPVATRDAANAGAGTTSSYAPSTSVITPPPTAGFGSSPTGPSSSPIAAGDAPGANVGALTRPGGFTTYDAPPGQDAGVLWSQHPFSGQVLGNNGVMQDTYGRDAAHPFGRITAVGGDGNPDNPNLPQNIAADQAFASHYGEDPLGMDPRVQAANAAYLSSDAHRAFQMGWGAPGIPRKDHVTGLLSGYAKGTSKVPGRGMPAAKGGKGKAHAPPPRHAAAPALPPMPAPQAAMGPPPGPMGPPAGPGGPPGMPNLGAMLQAAMGANRVPGPTPPPGTPQDRVPAMLTPGEAVLTPGAAEEMGRQRIAHANARHPPRPSAPGQGMPKKSGTQHIHIHLHQGK